MLEITKDKLESRFKNGIDFPKENYLWRNSSLTLYNIKFINGIDFRFTQSISHGFFKDINNIILDGCEIHGETPWNQQLRRNNKIRLINFYTGNNNVITLLNCKWSYLNISGNPQVLEINSGEFLGLWEEDLIELNVSTDTIQINNLNAKDAIIEVNAQLSIALEANNIKISSISTSINEPQQEAPWDGIIINDSNIKNFTIAQTNSAFEVNNSKISGLWIATGSEIALFHSLGSDINSFKISESKIKFLEIENSVFHRINSETCLINEISIRDSSVESIVIQIIKPIETFYLYNCSSDLITLFYELSVEYFDFLIERFELNGTKLKIGKLTIQTVPIKFLEFNNGKIQELGLSSVANGSIYFGGTSFESIEIKFFPLGIDRFPELLPLLDEKGIINGIEHLEIGRNHKDHSSFKVDGGRIDRLELKCTNSSGVIYISSVRIGALIGERLINENRIYLTEIIFEYRLHLNASDLGITTFVKCNFSKLEEIKIEGCKLDNIVTVGNHIPLVLTGSTIDESYNQLYLAMKKLGLGNEENKYFSLYLEHHRRKKLKELKITKKLYPSNNLIYLLKYVFENDWQTPFSLWLNKMSSNYGINWARSLSLILVIGFVLFFIYSVSVPGVELNLRHLNLKNFNYYLRYYFEFILPIHRFDFMISNPNAAMVIIDMIGRIFIGYLVYQFISAFRRFGKK